MRKGCEERVKWKLKLKVQVEGYADETALEIVVHSAECRKRCHSPTGVRSISTTHRLPSLQQNKDSHMIIYV